MARKVLQELYQQILRLSSVAPAIPQSYSRGYRSASSAEQPYALKNYGYWVKGNPGIKASSPVSPSVTHIVVPKTAANLGDAENNL